MKQSEIGLTRCPVDGSFGIGPPRAAESGQFVEDQTHFGPNHVICIHLRPEY